jgi:hypothetical protein
MKTRHGPRRIKKLSSVKKTAIADTTLAGSASGVASTSASLGTSIDLGADAHCKTSTNEPRLKRPLVIDPDVDTDIRGYVKDARRVYRQRNPAVMKRRGRLSLTPDIEKACEQVRQDLAEKVRQGLATWNRVSQAQWVKKVQEVFASCEDTVKPVVKAWLLRHVPHDQLPQSLRVLPKSK